MQQYPSHQHHYTVKILGSDDGGSTIGDMIIQMIKNQNAWYLINKLDKNSNSVWNCNIN